MPEPLELALHDPRRGDPCLAPRRRVVRRLERLCERLAFLVCHILTLSVSAIGWPARRRLFARPLHELEQYTRGLGDALLCLTSRPQTGHSVVVSPAAIMSMRLPRASYSHVLEQ